MQTTKDDCHENYMKTFTQIFWYKDLVYYANVFEAI